MLVELLIRFLGPAQQRFWAALTGHGNRRLPAFKKFGIKFLMPIFVNMRPTLHFIMYLYLIGQKSIMVKRISTQPMLVGM